MKVRNCGVLLLFNGYILCYSDYKQPLSLHTTFSDRHLQWKQTVHCAVRSVSLYITRLKVGFRRFKRWKGGSSGRSCCCDGPAYRRPSQIESFRRLVHTIWPYSGAGLFPEYPVHFCYFLNIRYISVISWISGTFLLFPEYPVHFCYFLNIRYISVISWISGTFPVIS